jgi:hypothetical protein
MLDLEAWVTLTSSATSEKKDTDVLGGSDLLGSVLDLLFTGDSLISNPSSKLALLQMLFKIKRRAKGCV